MTVKLDWGLQPPEGYEGVAWGARAIYSLRITGRSVIDLVWDRQCAVGDKSEVRALCDMLDTRGIDLLREACTSQRIRGDEHRDVSVTVGDYIIHGNPRESCGYLYIVAYRRPCRECKRGVPEHRLYFGVMGPFCNATCRESYLSRPTTRAVLATHTNADGSVGPVPVGELAASRDERSVSMRASVKRTDWAFPPLHNTPAPKSTPFEPSTISNVEPAPYKCNVPMCGESGVCDACRKRGAR